MTALLSYHVIPGQALLSSALTNNKEVVTALSEKAGKLRVERSSNGTVALQARGSTALVTVSNIRACEAVIHIVSEVLLPVALPAVEQLAG